MKESLSVNILLIIVKIDCLAFIRESSMTKKWCMGLREIWTLERCILTNVLKFNY